MSATSTLDGTRKLLTTENRIGRASATGSLNSGTPVYCLRRQASGYYVPCTATIVNVKPSGRVTVDLYTDKSERVTVSQKAILWCLCR